MNLINNYEDVLIGKREKISDNYFIYNSAVNERTALTVFKYAIEYLLGWSPKDAEKLFTPYYVRIMHLEPLLEYIRFPSDVTNKDTEYIVHLIYPKIVPYDIKKYAIRIYENVLNKKQKYPKDYMYGYLGLIRARICLLYALRKDHLFKTTEELYQFFSKKSCIKWLKEMQLYQLYNAFFDYPIEYIHAALPDRAKNNFYFNHYLFCYLYRENATRDQYHYLK